MFFQIFSGRLKMTFRDKSSLFWTLLFPFIIATLFYFAFSQLGKGDSFQKINVALTNLDKNPTFVEMLNETDLCNITKCDESEAKKLLDERKVTGIIHVDEELKLTVTQNGINQSILKNVLDAYQQTHSTLVNIIDQNPGILKTNFMNEINVRQTYTKETPIGNNTNSTVILFYALIAMTCLMGSTQAVVDVDMIQANQSSIAARINVAPTHKLKAFTASISTVILLQFISVLIAIAYMNYVLKIDFSSDIGWILLLIAVACFSCVMFGAVVSALIKKSGNVKVVIMVAIMNILCFFAGMMAPNMKYIIHTHVPILAYINPANLISDGLYSLYYYGVSERYFINLIILAIFGVVCCTLTYFIVRRQKYASI